MALAQGVVGNRASDSLALVALYNSMDGDNWANSWNLADSSINTWFGVTLNNDEDRGSYFEIRI